MRDSETKSEILLELLEGINKTSLSGCLKVVNQLVTEKFIEDYAISGGYALTYYSVPLLTYDLDLCCVFGNSDIVDMSSLFDRLLSFGYKSRGDYVLIEGFPVQFISAPRNGLTEEAVYNADSIKYGNVSTKIFKIEYLIAIMLEVGRPRDKYKLSELLSCNVQYNQSLLDNILSRYKLSKKWKEFEK